MGRWATSSCYFLVPLEPAWDCHTCVISIWWWSAAVQAQLYGLEAQIKSSSWWAFQVHGNSEAHIRCSVSTKAQEQTMNCLSKGEWLSAKDGRALLQNHKGLPCDVCLRACQRFQRESPSAANISSIIESAGCLYKQPGLVTGSSLVLGLNQN